MRGPINVIGKISNATTANCQFRNSIRMMPAISSIAGSSAVLASVSVALSNAERSTEKRDRISPRFVRAKNADGRSCT